MASTANLGKRLEKLESVKVGWAKPGGSADPHDLEVFFKVLENAAAEVQGFPPPHHIPEPPYDPEFERYWEELQEQQRQQEARERRLG